MTASDRQTLQGEGVCAMRWPWPEHIAPLLSCSIMLASCYMLNLATISLASRAKLVVTVHQCHVVFSL